MKLDNKKVLIIGAGNIGSRHLQGLKCVKLLLSIYVVDPSTVSLKIAKERYEQVNSNVKHNINFLTSSDLLPEKIDLAIISTSSNIRREVTEKLLYKVNAKNIIFEKLLFQKYEDYSIIDKLLKGREIKAWVNCSMRVTPFYANLKNEIRSKNIICIVNGSKYGFITNLIHFIDYIAYLTDCDTFTINTSLLDKKPYESKRRGFLEFNGTISVNFSNGSIGIFSCYKEGEAPVVLEILSEEVRAMANETNRKTWICRPPTWDFVESKDLLPYQSEITNLVVEDILTTSQCTLTPFSQSSKLHLTLLEELKKFLNKQSKPKYNYYPFT